MPYAIRVRLYHDGALEADTDPEQPEGASGAEIVTDLAASQAALVELCAAAHPGARLMGFGEIALDAYGQMIRERARGAPGFSYAHGYLVVQRHGVEWWKAHVDIAVSR